MRTSTAVIWLNSIASAFLTYEGHLIESAIFCAAAGIVLALRPTEKINERPDPKAKR